MTLRDRKIHRVLQEKGQLILAFFLPFALFWLLCACMGVTPFGPKSLFIRDMHNQYADYFSYLKSIASGENGFLYSFSMALGGDMVGFSAYYLLSPFNVLFLLFDSANYPFCVSLVMALKIGVCGLTAAIYLRGQGGERCFVLLFSTAYALMSYNILYASNIMWLDGVMALPLVALGIDRILDKGSVWLYAPALAYALFTNYYIGYMLCIFSVLYFLFRLFLRGGSLREGFFSALRFGGASLLAGGLCAFVLVPTFLSLAGTKAGFTLEYLTFVRNFSFADLADRLFFGSIDAQDLVDGLPGLWCGVLCMLGGLMFFFNSNIRLPEKLLAGALFLVLLLSLWINALNLVWHGFNAPIYFPYRYSFLLSFVLVFCSYRCMQELKGMKRGLWACGAAVLLWLAVLLLAAGGSEAMSTKNVILNALFLLAAGAGIGWYVLRPDQRMAAALLVLVQLGSLVAEGLDMEKLELRDAPAYESYVRSTRPVIEYVQQKDTGFYRLEKNFMRTANDAMHFAYNGLTHFSSSLKLPVKMMLGNFGYSAALSHSNYGRGSTMAMDSFLGVKYLFSNTLSCQRPYEPFCASEDVGVFQNPYALPLAFAADAGCLDAPLSAGSMFQRQNDLFMAAAGGDQAIFTQTEPLSISYENIDALRAGSVLRCERLDAEKQASVYFTLECSSSELLYLHFNSPLEREAQLYVNGNYLGSCFQCLLGDIVCLGRFTPGQEILVELRLYEDSLTLTNMEFYYESEPVLAEYCRELSSDAVVERLSSSRIRWQGSMSGEKTLLLFTVPYEENWQATVDGEPAEVLEVFGGLMAVAASPGEHVIEWRYVPKGLSAGICLSAAALLLGALWLLLERKYRAKNR